MVWVLIISIASPGLVSGSWGSPLIVGEYQTVADCKAGAASATYSFRDRDWKPFNEAAICIERPAFSHASAQ